MQSQMSLGSCEYTAKMQSSTVKSQFIHLSLPTETKAINATCLTGND